MGFYKEVISPALDHFDSETIHTLVRKGLALAEKSELTLSLLERLGSRYRDPRLKVNVGGIELENPVIVGAGWTKTGEAILALYRLGFSAVSVGAVLEHPQPGNPKPRQFVIAPGVAINRLGFNSPGVEKVQDVLWGYNGKNIPPVFINVGINKWVEPADAPRAYAVVVGRTYPYAAGFEINVSSPNTESLRRLQDKIYLNDILQAVTGAINAYFRPKPYFIKIAPDLTPSQVTDIIQVAMDNHAAGIVATNTTNNPKIKARYGARWKNEAGGLSGDVPELRQMSVAIITQIYRETLGALDIIGVGGIKDYHTALEKIIAGAKAVQVVTGLRGEGLGVAGKINRGIISWMDHNGVKNLDEIRGQGANKAILV